MLCASFRNVLGYVSGGFQGCSMGFFQGLCTTTSLVIICRSSLFFVLVFAYLSSPTTEPQIYSGPDMEYSSILTIQDCVKKKVGHK